MWSIIARTAFCASTNRSGPTPVVPYHAPWSTREVSEPGAVRYCGDGSSRPFSSEKRSDAYIGASSPVTQTSPSPWQPCASPVENSAPSTCTGRYSVVPATSWRVSMFPPKRPGGMIGCAEASAGQTPIVPMNGVSGIATSSPKRA